jgi:hypothetical protein
MVIRIARGRVLHHRDVVSKLGRGPHGCLHPGVRDKSHDDEPMDSMPLELQIQIRVGETWSPNAPGL